MEDSFKMDNMSFKEKVKELFALDNYGADILSEEEAETLLCYLDMYGYKKAEREGWTNPPASHFYELVDSNGRKAEIYFYLSEKEVMLMEYADEKRNILASQTLFVSKKRYDYIPERVNFGVIYTHDSYRQSEYIRAKNYEGFIRCIWKDIDIPNEIRELILFHNPNENDYIKLMNVRNYANKLREKNKEKRNVNV